MQFDTELLCREDKGNSLWLSLEKGLLSRQLPVHGGAASGPTMQSQWMGVLEKNLTHRRALLTALYDNIIPWGPVVPSRQKYCTEAQEGRAICRRGRAGDRPVN